MSVALATNAAPVRSRLHPVISRRAFLAREPLIIRRALALFDATRCNVVLRGVKLCRDVEGDARQRGRDTGTPIARPDAYLPQIFENQHQLFPAGAESTVGHEIRLD